LTKYCVNPVEVSKRTAASIWFEIWGVVDPGKQNFDFSRHISEKFRFFSGNFTKNSIFPGKFVKNFDIYRHIFEKLRFFRQF